MHIYLYVTTFFPPVFLDPGVGPDPLLYGPPASSTTTHRQFTLQDAKQAVLTS